jgi:hypothetical protein
MRREGEYQRARGDEAAEEASKQLLFPLVFLILIISPTQISARAKRPASANKTQHSLIPPTDWGACIAYMQRKKVRRE